MTVPTGALADGGLLGGGSGSPLPPITVPLPPPTSTQPQGDPVQQLVNTVDTTVKQVTSDVQQLSRQTSGSGGGGSQSGSGGPKLSGPTPTASGSARPTTASGSRPSSSGSGSARSGGGASHHPARANSTKPKQATAQRAISVVDPTAPGRRVSAGSDRRAAVGAATDAPTDRPPPKKQRGSVLTRRVHDIVHVLPGWLKPLLAALALVILAFGVNSIVHSRRAARLTRQRNELLEEVGLLQGALLPDVPERLGGLVMSVAYQPAEGPAAGGDFYDVFPMGDQRVGIIVGDISGHGKRALEHTSLLRYTLRAYLDAGLEPRAAIEVAGRALEDDLGGDFATVVVAIYDSEAGSLVYSTAGHPPPIALGPGQFEPVTVSSAPPIGVHARTGVRQTTITVPRGTDLCFFTDGLVEARLEGGMYGRERLAELLSEERPQPDAGKLLDRVAEQVDEVTDDMALCVVTVESKRAARAFRVEELELQADEVDQPFVIRFLEACGVQRSRMPDTISSLKTTAGEFGAAVLRVRIETGEVVVSVSSPPGVTHDLPSLHGTRLGAPIDL